MTHKIKTINYKDEAALVALEDFPKDTFWIKLDVINNVDEFKEAIRMQFPKPDIEKEKFDNLQLKKLEGTEI